MWSKAADSVSLFCLNIALFEHTCWHSGMMFIQLPKVTLPQQCCKEIVSRDIPSEMLHNSLAASAGVWREKLWQKNSLVSKPATSKQSARRFLCCFGWGGLLFAELSFQDESYKGQERANCSTSITFFLGAAQRNVDCSWTHKSNFEEKLLLDLRDSYARFVLSYSLTTSWDKLHFAWGKIFLNDLLYWDVTLGFPLQCPLSTVWLCDAIILMLVSF